MVAKRGLPQTYNEKTMIKKQIAEIPGADLELDENGNYPLPEDIVAYQFVPDDVAEKIAALEAEMAEMGEPTEDELIAEGRMSHPYFRLVEEIEQLTNK